MARHLKPHLLTQTERPDFLVNENVLHQERVTKRPLFSSHHSPVHKRGLISSPHDAPRNQISNLKIPSPFSIFQIVRFAHELVHISIQFRSADIVVCP